MFNGDVSLENCFSDPALMNKLDKIHEIHALDMKEFLLEFFEIDLEVFIRTLSKLTYFELFIYWIDDELEKGNNIDIQGLQDQLFNELERVGIFSDRLESIIQKLSGDIAMAVYQSRFENPTVEQILQHVHLKSADMTFLRHIALEINGILPDNNVMDFFMHVDNIREYFDDIQDYEEDEEFDFNFIYRLEKILDQESLLSVLWDTFSSEMHCMKGIAEITDDESTKRKFEVTIEKLQKEIDSHIDLISVKLEKVRKIDIAICRREIIVVTPNS